MLDFRKKVHHFVVNGGFVQETEAVVTDVMDTWLELANHVHPISIICNDQSKLDDAKIAKFEVIFLLLLSCGFLLLVVTKIGNIINFTH